MVAEPFQAELDTDAAKAAVEYALVQTERAARSAADAYGVFIAPDSFPGYVPGPLIHRGGQGSVFRAVQKSTGKTVAIKVLRDGQHAGNAHRARLKRETEILVRLNHPNIVGISDSGIAAGQSYFVMDYVEGVALDDYVRQSKSSLRATLDLLAKVCEAVHAAHANGIIHRDLKPGNVRVTAEGVPHVLDFGMARWVDRSDPGTAAMTVTETGQFVGSLPWASPEQVRGEWDQVDARTDVYSLGVILYHLLTGAFPYPVIGTMAEVLGNIAHADPVRPNARDRRIDGELETVLLTCLHKEPERRYMNAGALAADLRHYLAGEPIDAKRDSAWYVLRKKVSRYRAAARILSVGLLLAGAWAIHATVLLQRATLAENRSQLNALVSEKRLLQVQQAVQAILDEVSGRLSLVGGTAEARRGLLQFAYDQLQPLVNEAGDDARLQASLGRTHFLLGDLQLQLGETESGRDHLERALTIRRELVAREPDVREHRADLSINLVRVGDSFEFTERERRRPYYEEALAIDETLAKAEPGNTHYLDNLACSYERMGWLTGSEGKPEESTEWHRRHHELFERVAALEPNNATRLYGLYTARAHVASSAEAAGDTAAALEEFSKSHELISRVVELDPARPEFVRSFIRTSVSYSYALRRAGDLTKARAILDDAHGMAVHLSMLEKDQGTHLDIMATVLGARAGWAAGANDKPLSLHYRRRERETLEKFLEFFPDGTAKRARLAACHVALAELALDSGSPVDAREHYRLAGELAREVAARSQTAAELNESAYVMRRIKFPELRDLSIGIAAARKAVELTNEQWYVAWRELAGCLAADGQGDAAADAVAKSLALVPVEAAAVRQGIEEALTTAP